MRSEDAEFSFTIDFRKGAGDPRRVFDAASRFIDGLEDLDAAIIGAADPDVKAQLVLDDVESGSLKVILRSVLSRISDKGLEEGEWKKAIGPALVEAKYKALEFLDDESGNAKRGVGKLQNDLRKIASDIPHRDLLGVPPIHEGRLVASLDKLQDAKRLLNHADDRLSVQTESRRYEVDLSST